MSSESDADSEGEAQGLIRPSFIKELRNVLDEYPDGGQIIKELIQNAEDAGATTVKILTDTRTFHQNVEPKLLRKHPLLKFFKGPALCLYNDAQFTNRDWEGIRMLHQSVKEKDPLKVGRFGLGFKSVFHLTDRLVILSGKTLMYMDPFKPVEDYCRSKTVGGTKGKKGKELETLLQCLEGVFGVTRDTFEAKSGGFPGTVFWFPLRQSSSELSSTVYSQHQVHNLLTAFKAEAPSMLLFLNNIQRVTIYARDDTCGPGELFSVGLEASCLEAVTREREKFVENIREAASTAQDSQGENEAARKNLPERGCYCLTEVSIEVSDCFPKQEVCTAEGEPAKQTAGGKRVGESQQAGAYSAETSSYVQSWLVATYHAGQADLSDELSQLCADAELSYRPYVGVAVPLTKQEDFQSQVFCFLPLPLETQSPTKLPVHVHGYFALSQNRRHLKWPTADQTGLEKELEPPLRWNCLLVRELLPVVYGALLARLKDETTPNPAQFFTAWPDANRVVDKWSSLLQPLYTDLCSKPSFYSHSQGGKWINLQEGVLEELDESLVAKLGQELDGIKDTVAKVYTVLGEKLLQLPDYVQNTLQRLNLLHSARTMTAQRVSELLPASLPHLSHTERLQVLHFLCSYEDAFNLVRDQELLPLADGTFAQFRPTEEGSSVLFWCQSDLQRLFPGLESSFCQSSLPPAVEECLLRLVHSGKFNVKRLEDTDAEIPELIQKSLQARFGGEQPSLPCDDTWLPHIWEFLGTKQLSEFNQLTLLPQNADNELTLLPLSGVYVCSVVRGMTQPTPDLISCLNKLGVTVFAQLPDYVTKHQAVLGHWVHFPSPEGLLAALKLVNDDAIHCESATERFNSTATVEEKEAFLAFLAEAVGEIQGPLSLEMFRHLKLFTEVKTSEYVSLAQVSVIAPGILPPVTSERRMLSCSEAHRRAAVGLGASEATLSEIVKETIALMNTACSQFSRTQVTTFMKFLFDSTDLTSDTTIMNLIRDIEFVPTTSGQLRVVSDLYDPDSEVLQKLFLGEDRFPSAEFLDPNILKMLRSLGLRGDNNIRSGDIAVSAERIEQLLEEENEDAAVHKADGLEQVLIHHGQSIDVDTLRQLSSLPCLPCLKEEDRPATYPGSLPFSGRLRLERPRGMCFRDQIGIVGSVLPVLRGSLPTDIAQNLQVGGLADPEHVLKHLDNIRSCYKRHEALQYRLALKNVYDYLEENTSNTLVLETLKEKKCILTETGDCFETPGSFWMTESPTDISLQPYRFQLPSDLQDKKDLFASCGAEWNQDAEMLKDVLKKIQEIHNQGSRTEPEFDHDFQLVKHILDVLKKSASEFDGTVLLPVCHDDVNVLRFQQAKHCTIVSQDGLLNLSSFEADEEMFIVHSEIHQETAQILGALRMKDRALTGVEDLDFGYEQREELTTRLHNLLEESYTDGFSVPKELIQNADDAGATEVCFLLDERDNEDSRKNLITDNMESLQGPAFWSYNDATFSDADFENITKLGAGTKKEDASKVGRFGLGFNSVYNLTDVPSFISRHTLAMFDPHIKYLKGGAGLKLDFTRQVNRALLSRMPHQFKPFQGVFGCQLKNEDNMYFDGTMFRLPFRTHEQAADSKIKQESYGRQKRQEFLRMLLERAGNLLLFTQSVRRLKVFHLPQGCTDPSSAQCLLDLTKSSQRQVLQPKTPIGDQTILQFFTSQWSTNTNIQIVEDVTITLTVTEGARSVCDTEAHTSNTHWRLAWASGIDQAATLARANVQEGLVPLATVAALVDETSIKAIQDSPTGFYKTGHLFCFLPLPDTMGLHDLLVHVNGTFALSSSRRNLLESTEDDLDNKGAAWNTALMADAVTRAYLLLLENVKTEAEESDFRSFFELWPVSGSLFENFYSLLMTNEHKVLPIRAQNSWISFCDAVFLDLCLQESLCGETVFTTAQYFWNKTGHIVDIPTNICSVILKSGQARVLSRLEFFKDVFFPNIADQFFLNKKRDELVLYALAQRDSEIDELIRKHPCIPCVCPSHLNLQHLEAGTEESDSAQSQNTTTWISSNSLERAENLYHPRSATLQDLFLTEKKFPCGEFAAPDLLNTLQNVGLKSESTVKSEDITRSAEIIEELWSEGQTETAGRKAEGLLKLLLSHDSNFSDDTLNAISTIQCLPCLQGAEKPDNYPSSLPFSSETLLAKPREMCPVTNANIIGSAVPILKDGILPRRAQALSVGSQLNTERVLEHLFNVLASYDQNDVSKYRPIIADIFRFLCGYAHDEAVIEALKDKECVLAESGEFAKPKALWLHRVSSDIDLRPFRYPVPQEMKGKAEQDFLLACGAHMQQDAQLLVNVLCEIQDLHCHQTRSPQESDHDLRMVKQILDVLKKSDASAVASGSILLPICHTDPNILQFRPAKECTVMSREDAFAADSFGGDEDIFIVHGEIHQDTAVTFGALKMKDRALTDVEDLDFGYEQREELTTRLHNLLKDSYTDGFSVPKELIQNADDAGATEVFFLLDERENEGSKQNLMTDNMESLQGPAFWAYNNATFSDADFENIIKLGAGTKREDASKVGRFGLGFNSVYNLTDVPSFISRNTMAIFDPHVKYLKRGAGLKLDFRRPVNRALLSRMPQQFKPFQDVFGCQLKNSSEVYYDGTLFRFPFRTPAQALDSKIKQESYGREQRQEFLKMLLENAGNLLTFTQSVKRVKVLYLPSDCADPSSPQCLLDITKTSQTRVLKPESELGHQTILQYFTTHWPTCTDIKIVEDVKIEMTVTENARPVCQVDAHTSSTNWRLAWASGVDESAHVAARRRNEGLLPLAAVAGLLRENRLGAVQDSPPGFYKSGHRFCFLPLPENSEHSTLPVHLNATFALASSRRSLLIQTEDDLNSEGAAWNSALFADAVSRAYLLLLENVKSEATEETGFRRFFDWWPVHGDKCLLENFYKRLVTDENEVIPVPGNSGQWVTFSGAWFLEPELHTSTHGRTAWEALHHFWDRDGHLVDFPATVTSALKSSGQAQSLQSKTISELEFYAQSFFPNILSAYWEQTDRDSLVLHAIEKNSSELDDLVQKHACIPCVGSQILRRPEEVIHPHKEAAKLYLSSDGYFPLGDQADGSTVNFCDGRVLGRLVHLGMITDDLPFDMVVERASSVSALLQHDCTAAHARCKNIIRYLAIGKNMLPRTREFPPDIIHKLAGTKFLPVMSKPEKWPFPWAADELQENSQLAAPCDLYASSMKDLVGSHKLVLDTEAVGITTSSYAQYSVLQKLGVCTKADPSNQDMLELSTQQLQTISKVKPEDTKSCNSEVQRSVRSVYQFLNECVEKTETAGGFLAGELSHEDVVWNGTGFVDPSRVAFRIRHDCRPYRFEVETGFLSFRQFLQALGVKETFDATNLASLLQQLHSDFEDRELPDDMVTLASRAAQSLCESLGAGDGLDLSQIYLPDRHKVMQLTCNLCLDDCRWLKETTSMKFVSDKIPPETAKVLGVKSKRSQNLESMIKFLPFGQEEKLTDRINGLLEGYTLDSSLFKELLQNADDAGAKEIRFIKDTRTLSKEKVLEGCEFLQGPALCVFNDKSFTKRDMEGIQNLGKGSKGSDALKTGQYGVGFNAVYHITDVPSFWTLEDEEREAVCFLDPNCQYVAKNSPGKPGIKLDDIDWLRENYPDMFMGYLGNVIDMSKPGTLFRFPLRTEEMAEISEIKREAGTKAQVVTADQIESLLSQFLKEMDNCLLFLNNLRKIGIYSVTPQGTLEMEHEVSMELCTDSTGQVDAFRNALLQASNGVKNDAFRLQDIPVSESCTVMRLKHSGDVEEDWLTVHKCGFTDISCLTTELQSEWNQGKFRLLPRGGVAVKMAERREHCDHTIPKSSPHRAFCILPLPVQTSLPMHVNGHFALDHETRRNLWENKDENKSDIKTEWNEQIAFQIIVPAYVTALQWFKQHWFPSSEAIITSELAQRLKYYHSLFPDPDLDTVATQFWVNMTKKLYVKIAEQELPIFPVLCSGQTCSLEWLPAASSTAFAGYFNNLESIFSNAPDKPKAEMPVRLSQGGVQQTPQSHDNSKWVSQKAQELKTLLRKVNMKVLEAPFRIFENFKKSTVDRVAEISPESVTEFLRSACTKKQGSCNLANLPRAVADTSLETAANVQILLSFIKYKPALLGNLEGLPLCLRQSEHLYFFTEGDKPIVSRYFDLLPGSTKLFISKDIMVFFLPISEAATRWMRSLDIATLVELLPKTLPVTDFKTAQPCRIDESKLPSTNWLKRLWLFLESELKVSDTADLRGIRTTATEKLKSLRDWNFVPVKHHDGTEEGLELYPIRDIHEVVFLGKTPDPSNNDLWKTLRRQPLPFLSTSLLPSPGVLDSIVASITHPLALLKALNASVASLRPRLDEAKTILSHFSDNLMGLQESCKDRSELVRMLTSLPLFPSIYDEAVVISAGATPLCVDPKVHKEGLMKWASRRQHPLVLLSEYLVPEAVRTFLNIETLTTAVFYSQYLLPTLSDLPRDAVVNHMHVVKRGLSSWPENDRHLVMQQLKQTPFVELDGELHLANAFYSPQIPVFKVMGMNLPPKPYCDDSWKAFMTSAGMVSVVTEDMFLRFARTVEEEGRTSMNRDTVVKSETLVRHLFYTCQQAHYSIGFLQQLQDVRFVRPSGWTEAEEGKTLCRIAQPFCRGRLVSFAESCREQHLHLVWSSCCILHPDADPETHSFLSSDTRRNLSEQIGLTQPIPKDKIIRHVITVCENLNDQSQDEILASRRVSQIVRMVMKDLYHYLQRYTNDEDLPTLKGLTIVYDPSSKQMLKPENIVIDLRDEEAIRGHIQKAPVEFGEFFGFFKRLGSAERVTANHYAIVLSRLKQEAADNFLHVEEMKLIVKTAVRELFKCLRSEKVEIKQLTVDHVFLPSNSERLVRSTQLAFVDDSRLRRRFRQMPENMAFFLGFGRLEIEVLSERHELESLPDEHRLQFLTRVVQEFIPEEVKERATTGHHAQEVERLLLSRELAGVVLTLVLHSYGNTGQSGVQFVQQTAQTVQQRLRSISVMETSNLKTMLMWRNTGEPIPETEHSKTAFVDKTSAGDITCTVYLDKDKCDVDGTKNITVTKSLRIAVLHALGIPINGDYLQLALRNTREARHQMEEDGIEPCNFIPTEEPTVFPPPGTFIPMHLHCYLDDSFDSLYVGEHVGFEVYDPQVDGPNTDENHPVYIYAIVVEEIGQKDGVSSLDKRYRVDLGPERGITEVSATQLYKFIRKPRQDTPGPTAEHGSNTASGGASAEQNENPPKLKFSEVMKEIRQVLTEAWQTKDEKDRKRVMKRLYLKWHPDKNMGNETFCTRVVQRLQHYVRLLDEGKRLPDDEDDDEDNVDGSTRRHQSPGSSSRGTYSSFFEHMNNRSRSYREDFESNSRSRSHFGHSASAGSQRSRRQQRSWEDDYESFHYSSFTSGSNPQPGEGRRWLRQAQADLDNARDAQERWRRGYNWICFLCHQAAEKALKAVLYHRNANSSSLKLHDLNSIAHEVGDDTLQQLAQNLEGRVGNNMRMRYPDVLLFPSIPADVYSSDDARFAHDTASEILERVKSLILQS